jgi:hypothetical protein
MSTPKNVESVNVHVTKKDNAGETPPWDTEWAAENAAEALRYLGRNYPECLENLRVLDEHGGSRSKVAKQSKRSVPFVSNIANEEGIPVINASNTKKATEASAVVAEQKRVKAAMVMLDVGIELLEGLKGQPVTPEVARSFKDAAIGLAKGIDKDRLEAGEGTDRTKNLR